MQPALLSKLTGQFKKRAKRQMRRRKCFELYCTCESAGDLPTTVKKKRVKVAK